MTEFETVLLERKNRVALVTLNRPKTLNALDSQVCADLCAALEELDSDTDIGAVVITGSSRAFAAGADIKEMRDRSATDMLLADYVGGWDQVASLRKPVVAAVAGYALGGGCELAMMCDIIIAADTAKFGQPEITLGIMPGMGGTQRLIRAVGKAKAMDMILTGRTMDAAEAERCGLVARVVSADALLDTAVDVAAKIAGMSLPAVLLAKQAVNRAEETTLAEGLRFERQGFYSLFATADQHEGMTAFLEKRPPTFVNR